MTSPNRRFLFLHGPHGPFFRELAQQLERAGARCWRIGVNRGDEAEWARLEGYIPLTLPGEEWPDFLRDTLDALKITDLVIYGEGRDLHRAAQRLAQERRVRLHCLEEGYLRPHWLTYERDGLNGSSPVNAIPLSRMRQAVAGRDYALPDAPDGWGRALAHALEGLRYHGWILLLNHRYPNYRTHRDPGVAREVWLAVKFLLGQPRRALESRLSARELMRCGAPYHLVLLQLGHDSAMRRNSRYVSLAAFMETCIEAFARGAPAHHRLVFKTHPFEDRREPLCRILRELSARHGVSDRVILFYGGKLGRLLDHARSAVTVNSTAGQQALWRGLPLAALGNSVYAREEFVSTEPLHRFFANPTRPDLGAYRDYRRFLLETSQIRGSFYTRRGRSSAMRSLVDRMLDERDPYEKLLAGDDSAARLCPVGRDEAA